MYVLLLLFSVTGYAIGSHDSDTERIINGTAVAMTDYPYMVSFQMNNSHICGGTIISAEWVLSAAHCIFQHEIPYYSFRAGSEMSESGGQVVKAIDVKIHPKYNVGTKNNYDLALVKVSPPFNLGQSGINKIRYSMIPPKADTLVSVSGWGLTQNDGQNSPVLLAVDVKIVDRNTCNDTWSGGISDKMICAWMKDKDSCQNDSGGPLVNKATNRLVGVVSFGDKCASPVFPGVYAAITPSVAIWIRNICGKL